MLSLSKRRILRTALRFKYSDSWRIKWWLKDESLTAVAQSIARAVTDITNKSVPPNIKILKLNERKAVFQIKNSHNSRQSYVAKTFFLNRFEHRFKYHRYGLDEAANLITARDKNINTPKVYGYGHINDLLGFVKINTIILEDLPNLSPIGALMCAKSHKEHSELFMRTIPLFVSLYRAGCNHIDVNNGAVMLAEDNANPKVYLLDFQHSKFYDKPSTEILMFEAGHFVNSCRNWISNKTINEWLDKLLTLIGITSNAEVQRLKKRFKYYAEADLTRKHRKTLTGQKEISSPAQIPQVKSSSKRKC